MAFQAPPPSPPLRVHVVGPLEPRLEFVKASRSFVEAPPDSCDVGLVGEVLFSDPATPRLLELLAETLRPLGKPVVVFVVDDFELEYSPLPNLLVVRTSLRASLRRRTELVLPYLWECPTEPFAPMAAGEAPTVGFCGLATPLRERLMSALQGSPGVRCDFVRRERFWGGAAHDPRVVREFQENLSRNQFTVASRGAGNFSMRFYQSLAAGRIPVLVDTDMVLPFADRIPWRKLIVFEPDEEACVRRVEALHASGAVQAHQQVCAEVFRAYFGWSNYFGHLARDLRLLLGA